MISKHEYTRIYICVYRNFVHRLHRQWEGTEQKNRIERIILARACTEKIITITRRDVLILISKKILYLIKNRIFVSSSLLAFLILFSSSFLSSCLSKGLAIIWPWLALKRSLLLSLWLSASLCKKKWSDSFWKNG